MAMNVIREGFERDCARIIPFAPRSRAEPRLRHARSASVTDLHRTTPAATDCGSGWYHEAAIQEAERPRKP